MFAYMRYEDKHKAIVPIVLIKRFTQEDVDDFNHQKTKMVFWLAKDRTQCSYYKKILKLGGKLLHVKCLWEGL